MNMEKSEEKKELVKDLAKYFKALNVKKLYKEPDHKSSKDWLSEIAAILKNLDETDYKAFLNLRQHLYPSIQVPTRKHAAEQIDGFIRQKVAEYKRYNFEDQENSTIYIKQEIIEGFIQKTDKLFNYKKLVRLLTELNSNYVAGHQYSSSMLIRAILDHIPPLLGSFEEVANNYPWSKTDKEYMKRILDFRNDADDALHRQISKDQDLLEIDSLPNNNRVNRLLQECLNVGGTVNPRKYAINKSKQKTNDIHIELTDKQIVWANYGVSRYVFSSFRVPIKIDNFQSNKPDYVSVFIEAKLANGNKWLGNHFIFEKVDKPDEEFKIETNEIKSVIAFVSDYQTNSSTPRKPMPDFDKKTFKIKVSTRSGKEFSIPVEENQITKS